MTKLLIYIDVYLGINAVFDFCILWLLAKIWGKRNYLARVVCGAMFGGVSTVLCLILPTALLPFKMIFQYICIPFIMLWISFRKMNVRDFFYRVLCFYSLTFFFGGSLLAFNGGEKIERLLFLTLLLVVCGVIFMPWMKWRREREEKIYDICLFVGEKQIAGRAFLDTGNRLYEPLSHRPVLVCGISIIASSMSQKEWKQWRKKPGVFWIPYRAVGTQKGLLPALEAEKMLIYTPKGTVMKEKVLLGVMEHSPAENDDYQFILHEDFLKC